ncbi:UNVERIFIED_CONTAM: hypothetical protein FKN15_044956 [Acipenser sinensis]
MRPPKRVPANPSFFTLRIHSKTTRPIVLEDNTDLNGSTADLQAPYQPQGLLVHGLAHLMMGDQGHADIHLARCVVGLATNPALLLLPLLLSHFYGRRGSPTSGTTCEQAALTQVRAPLRNGLSRQKWMFTARLRYFNQT